MIKYISLAIMLFFQGIQLPAFSQGLSVKWAPSQDKQLEEEVGELVNGFNIYRTIGSDGAFTYKLGFKGAFATKMFILKVANGKSGSVVVKELKPVDAKNKPNELVDVLLMDKQLVMFSKGFESKTKSLKLFACNLKDDFTAEGTPVEVASQQLKGSVDSRLMSFLVSVQGERILAQYVDFVKPGKAETITYALINKDLSVYWETKLVVPQGETYDDLIFQENPKGTEDFVGLFKTQSEKGVGVYAFQYSKASAQMRIDPVAVVDTKHVGSMKSQLSPDKKTLLLSMFYNNTKSSTGIEGLQLIEFKVEGMQQVAQTKCVFSEALLLKLMDEKDLKKGMKPSGLKMDKIEVNADGSLTFVMEEFQHSTSSSSSDMSGSETDYYFFGKVIVFNITQTGNINWSVVIPKSQEIITGAHLSYCSVNTIMDKGNVYILFNADTKRYEKDKEFYFHTALDGTSLVYHTINNKGEIVKVGILPTPSNPTVTTTKGLEIKDGVYSIEATKRNSFGKVLNRATGVITFE